MPTSEVAAQSDPAADRGAAALHSFPASGPPLPVLRSQELRAPRGSCAALDQPFRQRNHFSKRRAGSPGSPEAPLAQEGRQPLTAALPWEGLLLLEEKTSSKTRIRKKETEKEKK